MDKKKQMIPKDWEINKLGNLCFLEYGSSLDQKDYDTFSQSFVYGTSGILGKSSKFLDVGESIVIGRKGTINNPIYIQKKEKFWVIDTAFYLKSTEIIKYLFYLLNYTDLLKYNESTGVPSINRDTFYKILVLVPKLKIEQFAIASILSALDDAIEKTDQLIEKYKRIKQGLMKDLFRYGIDENGQIRSEKTHKFKDSPLGRIPEEWDIINLGKIVNYIQYGYTESARTDEIGPKFLRITDIQDGKVLWNDVPYCYCNNANLEKYKLISGDIVFARTGATTGKSFYIVNPPLVVFASYLIKVRVNEKICNSQYIYSFFQSNTYWRQIVSFLSGSAQEGFNASKLEKLLVFFPSLSEQSCIASVLSSADEAIEKEQSYKEKLLALKRGLMEDLLTGKVRIPQDLIKEISDKS